MKKEQKLEQQQNSNSSADNSHFQPTCPKPIVSGSDFSQEEEAELQRLVRKIKYSQPTMADMEKADELTRKKWKSQGIG